MKQNYHTWEFEQHKSTPYVVKNEIINTYRPQLDGDKEHCPRCGHRLFRDMCDLFCLRCGWRECGYFGVDSIDLYLIQRLAYNSYRLA